MRRFSWALTLLAACSGSGADLASREPYERYMAVRGLARTPDAASVAEIVRRLEDPHFLVVVGALEALGDIGRPEFLQHVLPKLKAPHPMVRQYAVLTAARLGREEAVPALVEVLRADADPAVRRTAAKALAAFGARPDVRRALAEAVGDRDPSVSLMAHDKLQEITGRRDVPASRKAWLEALP
ncbi:MAG: HEAT repeat domain-containing protein [Planctomycetota bacterium]